jgi:hypothetical protein
MIYGLQKGRDNWIAEQMPLIEAKSPKVIDGFSIEPKGVDDKLKLVVEVHGTITAEQLRLLADALEKTPNS